MTKELSRLSFQKIAHFLIVLVILIYVIIVGKDILVPILLGLLLSFMLKPPYGFFCRIFKSKMVSSFLAIIVAFIPLIILGWFFLVQLQKVVIEFPDIAAGIEEGIEELTGLAADAIGLRKRVADEYLTESLEGISNSPINMLTSSLATSTNVLFKVVMTVIYTFLFLLYREPFKKLVMQQFASELKAGGHHMFTEVQQVAKKYFNGVLLVMLILGTLNSFGLYLIGIDFPFLWGFLAAMLAVIPYIGTILGGLLPFLYSFASGDGYWQPVAIIVMYGFVQALEGNFITPKIVGRSVNINPLAAIIALFIGEAIWGLAGMVVALPLLAIVRIVLDHIPNWQPIALALSDDFYHKSHLFETKYDRPRYRLINLFRKQNKSMTVEEFKDVIAEDVNTSGK